MPVVGRGCRQCECHVLECDGAEMVMFSSLLQIERRGGHHPGDHHPLV